MSGWSLSGTFEHSVNHLLDLAIDLSSFDARFRNDGPRRAQSSTV